VSKTLEELRVDLARFLGVLFAGTVEAGSDRWIIDIGGLAQHTEADALNGSLAYIRTAGAAAPEDESEWIEDYVPTPHPSAAELISNAGFETAGGGGADVFANWTESAGDGTIAQDAWEMEGDWSCKLTAGPSVNTVVTQTVSVVAGQPYLLKFWHFASDGTAGRYSLLNVAATEMFVLVTELPYLASWQLAEIPFVAPETCDELTLYLYCPDTNGDAVRFDLVSLERCGGIYLSEALTADVEADDAYEVYTVPLSLEQWDDAINQAIDAAWPQVFSREMWETASAEVSAYLLPDDVGDVMEVDVAFKGYYAGMPTETIPRARWRVEGTPGTDLYLHLHGIVPAGGRDLNIYYKGKYARLAAAESSDIDHEYVMLAGAARVYQILANQAGTEVASNRYIQLFNYYSEKAQERRDLLEAEAWAIPLEARKQGERGRRSR
jgi:hypothetical protein